MINKNELPKNWEVGKLGDIVEKKAVKALPTYYTDSKFIGMDCIEPHSLRLSFLYDFKDFKSAGNYFESQQVLYGRMRPYLNKVYKAEFDGVCSGEFIVMHCLPNFLPDLLQYILHSRGFVSFVNAKTSGDRPRVSFEEISDYPIALPPLAEQERIVAKIEELFSELDAGIQSLKTAAQQLKTYRQAVLKWAFEGKLTNDNVTEGELPQGWEWEKIGNVCKTIDGDRGKNYPKKNEFSDEGYCLFLSTKNVRDGRFVFEENIFITKQKDEILRGGKLKLNDVVITTRGTLGNVALYDDRVPFKNIRINSGMLILRITNPFLNNYYLMKFIISPVFTSQLKDKQTGTAQPQIPANILREIEIPFGSPEEQQRIVEEIESRLSVCDKLEETIADNLRQAESLRQSILKQAFEGKLLITN